MVLGSGPADMLGHELATNKHPHYPGSAKIGSVDVPGEQSTRIRMLADFERCDGQGCERFAIGFNIGFIVVSLMTLASGAPSPVWRAS
jgi:hypothetical protein